MRSLFSLSLCLLILACQQRPTNDVWRNYDWLPPDAEYYNPYLIPPEAQRGYYGQPATVPYDNDRYYVPPSDFGMCGGTSGLNCTE